MIRNRLSTFAGKRDDDFFVQSIDLSINDKIFVVVDVDAVSLVFECTATGELHSVRYNHFASDCVAQLNELSVIS